MAPAPIPADPTFLSSPINNSNKQLASVCVSRRFATPVALSSIQSSLSQQNQFAANTDSAVSIAEDQQSFNSIDSRLKNAPLNDIQSSRHTIKSSFNITTVDAFEEFTRNNTSTTAGQINQQSEALVVCEVRKSYNRLSLNNKNKRKNFLAGKRRQGSYTQGNTIKRAKLDQSLSVENSSTILTTEFSSCLEAPAGAKCDANMINGHSTKLLETRYPSTNSNLNVNTNQAHSNASTTAQQSPGNKISNAPPPIASLSNLGNTCFLNSVLYTLRFTPGFLHSLHHLVNDLGLVGNNGTSNAGMKNKRGIMGGSNNSSSNGGGISSAGYYNSATISGCGASGNSENESETTRTLDVVDQLHDLFRNMSVFDETPESNREPIPPNNFLQAIGKLNPMFEGNQQQDAHELLVTVLNTLQEIKIPVPVTSNNATTDVIDHASVASKSHAEMEHHNGISKKGKQKKTGKSIFYPGSGSSINSNAPNLSSSSSSFVSNGFRSTAKLDRIDPGSQHTKGESANHGNMQGENTLLPNFVKENFVGKSVMRTRCLECEASTYRSETFTNIDIPLTFDANDCHVPGSDQEGSDGQNDVKDLFLKQIMASETLRENNKYWCSECSRLNEAQRSVQYELLPQVMVLQLKRFTSTGSKSSYLSKICDHIPTPFTMNCFCTQCLPTGSSTASSSMNIQHSQQSAAKHHYRLYAVIMHLGATLASGHYTSYVRANDQALEYLQCQRGNSGSRSQFNSAERIKNGKAGDRNMSSGGSGKGIMKYFSRNSSSSDTRHNILNGLSSSGGSTPNGYHSNGYPDGCKSSNCCGIRTAHQIVYGGERGPAVKSSSSISVSSVPDIQVSEKVGHSGPHHQRSLDELDPTENNLLNGHQQDLAAPHFSDSGETFMTSSTTSEELWLECDDETIHVISRKQFEEELKPNRGYTTPYLLFYQKVT